MKANVLIIEDEIELANLIEMYLIQEGMTVKKADTAEKGWDLIRSESFDLITLDINLPVMDGFEFLQRVRIDHKMPVIIVSAREADEDIIMGLGIGADEFVTKPFKPKVLAARIRAMIRRSQTNSSSKELLSFGPYEIDLEGFVLKKDDKRIILSAKEFELLAFLINGKGKAFSTDELYQNVWGNLYGDITTIGVYVQRLRKKLETNPKEPVFIETIHGKGYRFNSEMLGNRK